MLEGVQAPLPWPMGSPRLPISQGFWECNSIKGLWSFLVSRLPAGVGDHFFLPTLECWGALALSLLDAKDPWKSDIATGASAGEESFLF